MAHGLIGKLSGLPPPPTGGSGTLAWQQLKLGAGGFVTGIQIATDGTRVVRTDTSGAYVWVPGATKWSQLNVKSRMPAGDVAPGLTQGSYAIGICKANSSHIYMYNGNPSNTGYLYHSTNQGGSFVRTSKASIVIDPNNQSVPSTRLMSPYIAVDPADPLRLYCASANNGLFRSTDGNTFSVISAVGTGTVIGGAQGGGHLIVFDPSSSVISSVTQGIYCSTYGVGVYRSTDGGANWSLLNTSGMPTTHLSMAISPSGTLWMIDASGGVSGYGAGGIVRYKGGAWSSQIPFDITSGTYKQFSAVAVNPADSNKVYATDYHGQIWYTLNGEAGSPTWVGPLSFTYSSADIPWMAWANDPSLGIAALAFDPTQSGVMYAATGIGVFKVTAPVTNAPFVYTSETQGIENLVVSYMVSVPSGGPLLLSSWDRPIWVTSDPTTYPARYFPGNAREIDPSRFAEYATGSSNVLFAIPQIQGPFKSIDSGANWSATGLPAAVPNDGHSGNVAMGSATNWVWLLSNGQGVLSVLWYTTNGGTSWTACTVTGGDNRDNWFHHAYYYSRCALVADRVAATTYYLYNGGLGTNTAGLYRSTDGATFTRFYTGTIGAAGAPSNTSWQMTSVPTRQGHIFMAVLQDIHSTVPNGMGLFRSSNADTGNPIVISQVSFVQGIASFGFGKAKPGGGGYPAMYLVGFVSQDSGATYNYGAWRSDDMDQVNPTWTNIGDGYPGGVYDYIYKVEGDMNNYGYCYVTYLGSGAMMYR